MTRLGNYSITNDSTGPLEEENTCAYKKMFSFIWEQGKSV